MSVHMNRLGVWWETACGRPTIGDRLDGEEGPQFILNTLDPDEWAMLPHVAQCKACRRRGGLAARCLGREDEIAMEIALHAVARLLAAIPGWKRQRATKATIERCAAIHARLTRGAA